MYQGHVNLNYYLNSKIKLQQIKVSFEYYCEKENKKALSLINNSGYY